MYVKRCTGALCLRKSDGPRWVRQIHHSQGGSHCHVCLMLGGCFFLENKAPLCPHHPNCHCTLEPVNYAIVLETVAANSAYGKFDPYLFNTTGKYTHGKEKLFKAQGYTVDDIPLLKAEYRTAGVGKIFIRRLDGIWRDSRRNIFWQTGDMIQTQSYSRLLTRA